MTFRLMKEGAAEVHKCSRSDFVGLRTISSRISVGKGTPRDGEEGLATVVDVSVGDLKHSH